MKGRIEGTMQISSTFYLHLSVLAFTVFVSIILSLYVPLALYCNSLILYTCLTVLFFVRV